MPAECPTCGSEDFELMGGHYYCITCQTQSQTVREEETPDAYELAPSGTMKAITISRKAEETLTKEDKGRPWRTIEAFQIILKAQVEALIKLGVSPELKDTVFKFWVSYLSKTGEAFCSAPDTNKTRMERKLKRARDVVPLTTKSPNVGKVRSRHAKEKAQAAISEITHKVNAPSGDELEQMEDEDSDVDDQTLSVAMVMEEDQDEETGNLAPDPLPPDPDRKLKDERVVAMARNICVARMSMAKTVSFLHLGLLYTDPLVTPLDLLRLINEGRIPYYSVISLLPKEMKFYSSDWYSFSDIGVLTMDAMLTLTSRLARYLGIQQLPQPSVLVLTCKLIRSLNLPVELHGLMHLIVEEEDPGSFRLWKKLGCGGTVQRNVTNQELVAMAYVILLLRMVFRLDGYTEKILSDAGKVINSIQGVEGPKCFMWSEWTAWLELETMRRKGNIPPENIRTVHQVSSVSSMAEDLGGRLVQRRTDEELKNIPANREEVLDQLKRPLGTLLGKLRTAQADHAKAKLREDGGAWLMQDTMEDDHMAHEQGRSEQSSQMEKDLNLRKSSLQYILRPKSFLDKMGKQLSPSYHSNIDDCGSHGDAQSLALQEVALQGFMDTGLCRQDPDDVLASLGLETVKQNLLNRSISNQSESVDLFATDTESLFSTPKKNWSEIPQVDSCNISHTPVQPFTSLIAGQSSPSGISQKRQQDFPAEVENSMKNVRDESDIDTQISALHDVLDMDKRLMLQKLNDGYDVTQHSLSYYWLVQACSVVMCCTPEQLHKAVLQVQGLCENSSRLKGFC